MLGQREKTPMASLQGISAQDTEREDPEIHPPQGVAHSTTARNDDLGKRRLDGFRRLTLGVCWLRFDRP